MPKYLSQMHLRTIFNGIGDILPSVVITDLSPADHYRNIPGQKGRLKNRLVTLRIILLPAVVLNLLKISVLG